MQTYGSHLENPFRIRSAPDADTVGPEDLRGIPDNAPLPRQPRCCNFDLAIAKEADGAPGLPRRTGASYFYEAPDEGTGNAPLGFVSDTAPSRSWSDGSFTGARPSFPGGPGAWVRASRRAARDARRWFHRNESFLMAGTLAGLVAWYSVVSGVITFSPRHAPHTRPTAAIAVTPDASHARALAPSAPSALASQAPAIDAPSAAGSVRQVVRAAPVAAASLSKPAIVRPLPRAARASKSAETPTAKPSQADEESAANARREIEAVTQALAGER
jgi:hypothetical protein